MGDPEFFELAGVDSWYALAETAEFCSVDFDGQLWELTPHRYMGRRKGYCEIPEQQITLSATATDEELARAIFECLQISAKERPLSVRVKRL